jgi:hypothetical protein
VLLLSPNLDWLHLFIQFKLQSSSSRFKSLAVTAGISFWFFIILTTLNLLSYEIFIIFVISILITTQIFTKKISKGLDILALINTKIFLGIIFITLISLYGILFRFLRIDLLRLKKQNGTYWLDVEQTKHDRIRKQY